MKRELRPAIHVEKQLGWAHKLGGTESQGISRAGQTVLARLMGVSDMALCGERVQERDNGLRPLFCVGESCPPALALMPDTSVSPSMPLVPFNYYPSAGAQRD